MILFYVFFETFTRILFLYVKYSTTTIEQSPICFSFAIFYFTYNACIVYSKNDNHTWKRKITILSNNMWKYLAGLYFKFKYLKTFLYSNTKILVDLINFRTWPDQNKQKKPTSGTICFIMHIAHIHWWVRKEQSGNPKIVLLV